MPPLRLYIETSVWSHYFADDAPQWREATRRFFEAAQDPANELTIHVSQLVIDELLRSPAGKARELIELVERMRPSVLAIPPGIIELAAAYARYGAIPPKKESDARHAAMATIHELDALVSWNYRHLVNIPRRRKINIVNKLMGYNKGIEIVTPQEVMPDVG
jgi:predicted nucleic acid-binding protein